MEAGIGGLAHAGRGRNTPWLRCLPQTVAPTVGIADKEYLMATSFDETTTPETTHPIDPTERPFTSASPRHNAETRATDPPAHPETGPDATARDAAAWTYVPDADPGGVGLTGFAVEAEDGHIGKVEEANAVPGDAYIVVDTGHLMFGKQYLVPASKIRQVNPDSDKVFVSLTQDQVKEAPEFDPALRNDPVYRRMVVEHYAVIRR